MTEFPWRDKNAMENPSEIDGNWVGAEMNEK